MRAHGEFKTWFMILWDVFGVICLNVDNVIVCTSRFCLLLCLVPIFLYRNANRLVLRRFDEPLTKQVASAFNQRRMPDKCGKNSRKINCARFPEARNYFPYRIWEAGCYYYVHCWLEIDHSLNDCEVVICEIVKRTVKWWAH